MKLETIGELQDSTDVDFIKVRHIACGGTGMNIAQLVTELKLPTQYIDGSKANETDQVRDSNHFYIPGLKGAGSNRKLAYAKAKPVVTPWVEKLPPAGFTIVTYSLGGGSGSVIGPLVVAGLLAKGETVVSVVVGVPDNGTHLKNTIDTLKSLEGISAKAQAPVVITYHENQAGVSLEQVDDEMALAITTLARLADQNNHGLDEQDVHNWANYNKVTPVHGVLSALSIFDSRQEAATVLEPIATLSLYDDRAKSHSFGTPYYTKSGYPREHKLADDDLPDQLHFVISVKLIDDVFGELNTKQTAMNRSFSGFRNRKAIVDVDDTLNDDGMTGV